MCSRRKINGTKSLHEISQNTFCSKGEENVMTGGNSLSVVCWNRGQLRTPLPFPAPVMA